MSETLERALRRILGDDGVGSVEDARFHRDATEAQGLSGIPSAVALPGSSTDVAAVVRWCYEHDVGIVPRGGGTGFAGGSVAVDGGVVVDLKRMSRVLAFDPPLWRMHVEAGLRTSEVHRLARENGLLFPPDPGAAEQSQIGGNVATNAGGPHAFKYGVTGHWVTGLEAVMAPGEVIVVGGAIRKDVAGYDLKSLLVGSEGTLGIITSVWLRLTPAPAARAPVIAAYGSAAEGCEAIEAVLANGIVPAALEFLDAGALDAARGAYPFELAADARFMVVAEVDGSTAETDACVAELLEVLAERALHVASPASAREIAALWRWRDGLSLAVEARRGGKISEDIVVPLDRLRDAIEATLEIAREHELEACSWGHAGDGNLHSTFMVDPRDSDEVSRARAAAHQLYAVAVGYGGSISGEHGLGWVRRGQLVAQCSPATLAVHHAVKRSFDPKGLMNPGKKL
ncbi:MAG TPA: FAD-linked oxidase C-terminal domain-containing protein [Solirubrobacteraceae bacterium]|jgi:glycolate oxidase subunit GlcD|nr:FAD-linked oxidase C-terminal domain-containing protein [Solirubrobacteraceae bacterium]